jgi:ribosomal-protein-serine acetyltransferase
MQSIVVSPDCSLTPLELQDAEELFALTDFNRGHLRNWLPWLDSITRVEDTRAFIRAARAQASQNNGAQLAIRVEGQIAGIVGHHQIDWRNRLTSLGYWIGSRFQGRGLVTSATRSLVTHAFRVARLNRVEIRCAQANQRSRAIPQRLGFREEGLLGDAEWLYDHFVDHVVYAMLARDWVEPSTSDGGHARSHSHTARPTR